ncbi:MAG: glycosyltransferase family 4 protein, partial [Phycisphaerae bacterium]
SRATMETVRRTVGGRLELVYPGIAMPAVPAARCGLRAMVGAAEDARVVGLVGTLTPIKGHRVFIDAAALVCAAHDNVHFVCIGGPGAAAVDAYIDGLHALRARHGLDARVHFMGHRADAAALVADFDVATVCTLPPGEGFGMVIVEAMARAVPVVATRAGATPEIITHGETGLLIPPGDARALARAVGGLLVDAARRRAIGQAGLAACRARFDLVETIRRVESVYDRVIAD